MSNLNLNILLSAVDKITAPFKSAAKASNTLSTALKDQYEQRKTLEKQQKLIGAYRELEKTLSQTANQFDQAKTKASQLKTELKNSDNPTTKLTNSYKKAQESVQKLKVKHIEQIAKLKEMRTALQQAGISSKNLSAEDTKLKTKIDSVTKSIDKQKQSLERLNKVQAQQQKYQKQVETLKNTSDKTKEFGQRSMVMGGAVLGTGAAMIKPAVEFEQAFAKVQALTRLDKNNSEDAAKIKALRDQAINLGATTSFTSTDVANGQNYLAMAGFNTDQITQSMPAILNMTKAADMDMGRVSDISSDILSGFGKKAEDMGHVADVLTLTFTISNVNLEMLGESMKYVGPIATKTGQSFESMAAMVGLLGNVGIKGSQAGTALRAMLNRLSGPTKEATKQLNKLGIKTKDAKGNLRAVPDILADIAKKTKKMGSADQIAILKDIFGEEAATAAAELIKQAGEGNIEEFFRKLKEAQDTSQKVADVMSDNLMGDLKGLDSAREALGITIFDGQSKALRELTQTATGWLRTVNEWIKANPELTSKIIRWVAILASAATVIGAVSIASSFMLYPLARMGLGIANITRLNRLKIESFKDLIKVIGNVNKASITNAGAWLNWNKAGRNALTGAKFLGVTLFKLLNPLTYIKFATLSVINILKGLLLVIRLLAMTPIGLFITTLIVGATLIYKNWDKVKAFFGGFIGGLMTGLAPVIEAFRPLSDLFGVLVGWVQKAFNYISNLLSPTKSTSAELDKAAAAGKKLGKWIAKGIDIATKPLQWVINAIKWIVDNTPSINEKAQEAKKTKEEVLDAAYGKTGTARRVVGAMSDPDLYATGGYTGSGGKYDPAGIVHRGEFVFTKEATSRLGTGFLSTLHQAKTAKAGMLAAGLASSVAFAQPVSVDNRPPIAVQQQRQTQVQSTPMNISININVQNGNPEAIATAVRKEIESIQRQQQVKNRSLLSDRD
ncbi:phage tail tape measure protein [Gallibacterium sp. ZY190522]